MEKREKVVMLGPSLAVNGGISRIASQVCQALPESVELTYIPTFTQYTGYGRSDKGSKVVQFIVFMAAFARTALHSLLDRGAVFHLHVSQRGSFVRKGILALWLRAVGARFIVHNNAACDGVMFLRWMPRSVNRAMVWGLRGADACLVVTDYWKKYYVDELGFAEERITILPNPTSTPPAVPARCGRETIRIVFLGRIGKRKGAFDLIRAFARLPALVRERCQLTMAGDGEVDDARQLVQSLACAERVTLTGWLSAEDVSRTLAQSDIFVLPSYGEGMSAALLEAMGWGLAIVTTAEGGADEFLHNGTSALLVRAGHVEGITEAMERLVMDEGLRLSLGRHARRAAMPFDLRHHVERLVDIYQNVSGRGANEPGTDQVDPDSAPLVDSSPGARLV